MAKYFIYSSHEALSREQLPKYIDDQEYICIDWMEEHDKVAEFLATRHSGPSSFPMVVEEAELASLPSARTKNFVDEIMTYPDVLVNLADLMPAVGILEKVGPAHPLAKMYWNSLKPKLGEVAVTLIEESARKYKIGIVDEESSEEVV